MTRRGVVVTVGEGLLRLTPAAGGVLPRAASLDVHVGGAEANVAAGLATLGVPARWFSRVADGPTGDAVLRPLAALGVDVGTVLRAPGRTGLYFVEEGAGVRPARVTYDRDGSTFAGLAPSDLSDDVLDRVLHGAGWLHATGIDLAVAGAPVAALACLWDEAGRRGLGRSFDVNVRTTLPEADRLAERAAPYVAAADVAFVAERDARALDFGGRPAVGPDAPFAAVVERLVAEGPGATWIVTRGADGAFGRRPSGATAHAPALPADGPGRIGRGDAFAAGFLSRWVAAGDARREGGLAGALAHGVAAASVKASLAGDLPDLDAGLVARLAAGEGGGALHR